MGHVKQELRNDGRGCTEFLYTPMSEPRVVKTLIIKRAQLDPLFYLMREESGVCETAGIYETGDPVVNTFIDLDSLIERTPLNEFERMIVDKLMYGYSYGDIATATGKDYHEVRKTFMKAVFKITQTNNLHWEEVYANSPLSKRFG